MGISRGRLENRIIISFIVVALSPLLFSFLISTHLVNIRLEREMKGRLSQAAEVSTGRIEELEKKAEIIGKILVQEGKFREYFLAKDARGMENFLKFFKGEFPVDVILVREGEMGKPGKHIFLLETEEFRSLVAGAVVPVILGGGNQGRVILGYFLGNRFTQFLSRSLGLEVRIYQKGKEADDLQKALFEEITLSPKARVTLLKNHKAYYEAKGKIGNNPYALHLEPLLGEKGKVLGVLVLGFPKRYTFQSVIIRFFPYFLLSWFFIAAVLGYILARAVMKPIKEFTQGARAIAEGDLDQYIPVRTKDEIGRLAQAFNDMAQELKETRAIQEELRKSERLITVGEIAAGIAHEIRNPLGVIKNSAQTLKERKTDREEEKELLEFIIEESERLERVVKDFLQLARLPRPHKKRTEMKELMERILSVLGGEFKKRNIKLVKDFPYNSCYFSCDPEQFHHLFLNLILNSLEAMPKGGELFVGLKSQNGKMEIRVRDTGTGIPQEITDKIFEPFFTTRPEGTGLGLSIVAKIVKFHRGEIKVESKLGEGTLFRLIFSKEKA